MSAAASAPTVRITIESSAATNPSAFPTVFSIELREDSIEPERAWMVRAGLDIEVDTEVVVSLCGSFELYRQAVEAALADADEDVRPEYAPALGQEQFR